MVIQMKNMIMLTGLFLGMLFAMSIAFAAPAALQFVINNQTNECAMYWPGDEFVNYILPGTWTITNTTGNMTQDCIDLNFTYIGGLTNITRECITNCATGTVLNETTCMCDEPVPMLLNETNQTSPNVTTINLPQFNIKAILSDPTTLLALGIIVAVVIVFIVMRKKKMRENAANFHFP